MVEWIVSSSVLIAVVILLRFVLKGKLSLRLQYALWAVVLVRLLVPISFGDTAMSVENLTQDSKPVRFVSALSETEVPKMSYEAAYNEVAKEYADKGIQIEEMPLEQYAETVDYEITDKMSSDLSIAEIAQIVWLCGIALVGAWFLISNLRLAQSLKKTRTLLTSEYTLPVYLSDAIDTPCLFGLFHPAIYLTHEAVESEHTQRHAVEHELTHFHHKDNIWAILRSVCLAIHWFNPLVWCAAVLSRNDAELACDESTILRLGEAERAAYGRTLIHLTCEKRPALLNTATTMTGSGKSIKERIALIVKKPKMAGYTLAAVIMITVVAVGCTFTGAPNSSDDPDNNLTGQYANMEDYINQQAESQTTVSLMVWETPWVVMAEEPVEATITDRKLATLEQHGQLEGLDPNGTLEAWSYRWLVKVNPDDVDVDSVVLSGGIGMDEDGYMDLSNTMLVIALQYQDGSYDVLEETSLGDGLDFFGYHHSTEESLYDWYVQRNNLDLPLYVEDWIDRITVPEGGSLGNFPVHRYDGDGWYIYIPVQAWDEPIRNSAGNYECRSQYATNSCFILSKSEDSVEVMKDGYAAAGRTITKGENAEYIATLQRWPETDDAYIFDAGDGGCYVLHAIWYDDAITDYPYIAMEPDVLRLMAESFTVTAQLGSQEPDNSEEQQAMVQALLDATMEDSSLTWLEGNTEMDLVRNGATMDVLQAAAANLQVLDDPTGFDSYAGGPYLWLDDSRSHHISFFAGKEPYQVLLRYVGNNINESAVAEDPQLYLYLMAAAEKENVELHDLDGDGLLEGIIWPLTGNRRNIVIYDMFDNALQRIDVNEAMGCKASDYTGLIANIQSDYNNMVQIVNDDGTVDVYKYLDGSFTYVCPLNEVTGKQLSYAVVALTAEEIAVFNEQFSPILYDRQGNPIGTSPWTCFFTSYYDSVKKLDFEEFMRYFPGDGSHASESEFEALKDVAVWPFKEVETLDAMPVPVHKYPARLVNLVLGEYAGITTDDLDTSKVAYLAEYDAYYNYTSDYGPGMFVCTRGETEGDIVRLYEETPNGTDMLTLRKNGTNYRIISHQRIEG